MGRRWSRVADLEVAPQVQRLLGGEIAVQELLAQLTGPVWCQRCQHEVDVATSPLSLLAMASDPTMHATGGVVRVAFAHASCLPSRAVIDPDVTRRFFQDPGTDVVVVCGLRPAVPRAFVAWESSGTDLYAQSAASETLDLAITSHLERGFAVVTGDPLRASLPIVSGLRVHVTGNDIRIAGADGNPVLEATAPMPEGWQETARRKRRCVLFTGTDLRLASGRLDGLQAASRAGRLAGAAARLSITPTSARGR